ncbi:hypothetical protein CGC20_31615 [Leishmania donovani]|uniref:Uncharacterized protein n=1 Tax=Leishmania donovani TaxID=5661 RepID=A0A504X8W1_LEIDO|nr:hypothetical protein CGC20_31615 [Leishmania donovani]
MESYSVKVGSSSQSPEGSAAGAAAETLTSPTVGQAVISSNCSTTQAGNFPHLVRKNLAHVAAVEATATAAESVVPMQSRSLSLVTGTSKSAPASTGVFAGDMDWPQWGLVPVVSLVVTPASGSSAAAEMNTAPTLEMLGRISVLSTDNATVSTLSPPSCDPIASCHDFYRRLNSSLGVSSASSVPLLRSIPPPPATSLGDSSSCSDDSAAAATAVSPLSTLLSRRCSGQHPPSLLNSQTLASVLSVGEADAPLTPPSSPSEPPLPLPDPAPSPQASRARIAAAAIRNPDPASSSAMTVDPDTQRQGLPLTLGRPPHSGSSSSSLRHLDSPQPLASNATVLDRKEDDMAEDSRGTYHQAAAAVANGDASDAGVDDEGGPETNSAPASRILKSISKTLMGRASSSSHNTTTNAVTMATSTAATATGTFTPNHSALPLEKLNSDSPTPPPPCAWSLVYANDAAASMLGCSSVDEVTTAAFDNLLCCFALTLPPSASAGSIRSSMPLVTAAAATDGASVPFALASLPATASSSSPQAACFGEKEMASNDENDDKGRQKHQQPSSNAVQQPGWREVQNPGELFALPNHNYVILYSKRTSAYYAALAVPSHQPKMSQQTSVDGESTPRMGSPSTMRNQRPIVEADRQRGGHRDGAVRATNLDYISSSKHLLPARARPE